MKLEYTLTLGDFKAAQGLHYRQTLGRRVQVAFWNIIVPALAALGLAALLFFGVSRLAPYDALLFGIECGLLAFAIINPIKRRHTLRKAFNQLFPPTCTERSCTLEIDENHILSTIPGVSEGKFFWNALVDFAQDDRITLLYVAKTKFLFFPTSSMTDSQRTELNNLIAKHLARR
jgi:hypothetical protein